MKRKRRRSKSLLRRIRYFWGRMALAILIRLVSLFPLSFIYRLSERIGTLGYRLLVPYRNRILSNLEYALGDKKGENERKEIAKEVMVNLVKGFFEMLYACFNSVEEITERIEIQGKEKLDKALAKKRGVIAIGAHVGNFSILGTKLSQEGYPFSIVVKDPRDPRLARMFEGFRKKQGQDSIPIKPASLFLKRIIKDLREKRIVLLIVDESRRYNSSPVIFFKRPYQITQGPVVIALRTGSPILPIFIVREDKDRHRIIIEDEIPLANSFETGGENLEGKALFQDMMKTIEEYIDQHPSQWPWLNMMNSQNSKEIMQVKRQ